MKSFKLTLLTTMLILGSSSFIGAVSVGERASYVLNKDSNRTSLAIESGRSEVIIDSSDEESGHYNILVNYTVAFSCGKTKETTLRLRVPNNIFALGFYNNLQFLGQMQFGTMKLEHLGRDNASDAHGRVYEGCHFVRIYDIDQSTLLQISGDRTFNAEIADLELMIKVCHEIPAIGAVQMDIQGSFSGMIQKIGFDFMNN